MARLITASSNEAPKGSTRTCRERGSENPHRPIYCMKLFSLFIYLCSLCIQVVYETESSSSDDEVVAVVKRRKAAKKKKKSNARVIFTDELDDSDDDNDKSLEQQYVDVPRQPQLVFL